MRPRSRAARTPTARLRWLRLSVSVIILQTALVGGWAAAAPESFARDFPGLGLHWTVWADGTDLHFVRDVGFLHLALLVMAGSTLRRPERGRLLGAAWTVMAVPHLLFHATHRAGLSPWAAASSLTALTSSVAAGLILMLISPREAKHLGPGPVAETPDHG